MFWLLMCGHLLGDFYFQSQKLADEKKNNKLSLMWHSIIYFISLALVLLPIMSLRVVFAIICIAVCHFIVDLIKLCLIKQAKENSFFYNNAFYFDQIIHMAIILVIAYIYANNKLIALNGFGNILLGIYEDLQVNLSPKVIIRLSFAFMLVGKPANILIKVINQKGNVDLPNNSGVPILENKQRKAEYQNAGRLIGTLERIIIIIMVLLKQYAAIGLVFTAKSIARYDEITKNPSFSEYYLVGTLLSVIIAMFAILCIQPI